MGEPAASCAVNDSIATITLNRPKERNSLSASLVNCLGDSLKACMSDPEVRVVVLTNAGNTFCAGASLKNAGEASRYTLVDLFTMMHNGPKVVVGRINGHCTGGGVGLAAACDISLIANTADVGFTEVRIGASPAMISVVCLPKMSRRDAAELMLSGEKVPAERAVKAGLFNYAVPPDELDARMAELLVKLLKGGPNAVAVTKSLIYRVPAMSVDDAFQWTAEVSAKCFASQEARDGIAAFMQRKDAPWVNRQSKL